MIVSECQQSPYEKKVIKKGTTNAGTYLVPGKVLYRDFREMINSHFGADACPEAAGIVVAEEEHPGIALLASGGGGGDADGESTRMGETEHGRLVPTPLD